MQPNQCLDEAWKNISKQNGEQGAEGAEAVGEGQEVDEEVAVVSVKKEVLGCATVDEALAATEQTLILRRKEIAEAEERRNRYLEVNEALRNELEDFENDRLSIELQRSYNETELSYIQEERSSLQMERTRLQKERTSLQMERTCLQIERTSLQMERTRLQVERTRMQTERSRMNEERLSLVELRISVEAALLNLKREHERLDEARKLIAQQGQVLEYQQGCAKDSSRQMG